MRLKALFLAWVSACVVNSVSAQEQTTWEVAQCKIDYTTYIHVNGIATSLPEAEENSRKLNRFIRRIVETAYNKKGGALADIWEVLKQKVNEFPDLTEAEFAQIAQDYSVEREGTRDFQKAVKKLRFEKAKSLGNVSLADPSMAEIRTAVDKITEVAPPVALLPHSQGNLYAQGVYNHLIQTRLYDPKNIGVFGVATPGDYVPGENGQYVTSKQDGVIGLLRLFFWNVLPGNVDVSATQEDWLGHNLIDVYLNTSLEALSLIQTGVKALVQPFTPFHAEAKTTGVLFAGVAPTTTQFSDKIGLWIQEPTGQITPFEPRGLGSFTTQGGYSIPGTINVAYGAFYELPCNKMKPGPYAIFTNDQAVRPNDPASLDIPFVFDAYGLRTPAPLSFARVTTFTNTELRPVLSWTVTADEPNNRYVITRP